MMQWEDMLKLRATFPCSYCFILTEHTDAQVHIHCAMKSNVGLEVSCHIYTATTLPIRKTPNTHWVEGWVGPRAILDAGE
jgi:hypothetical protein